MITSFSREGFELYGERFLETYVEHVDAPLTVYYEYQAPEFEHPLVSFRNLMEVPGTQVFLNMSDFPAAHGHAWGEDARNYRYDVHKFCRKSFAQCDAAASHGKWLYWIDADVEFTSDFTLPKREAFMLVLDRPEWHSCASFVGWDLEHPTSGEFWRRLWTLYVTGTVFALPEWHDSYVNDWLREQMHLPYVNLAAGLDLKGPANVFNEVFESARHFKGALKNKKVSGLESEVYGKKA